MYELSREMPNVAVLATLVITHELRNYFVKASSSDCKIALSSLPVFVKLIGRNTAMR